MQHLPFTRMTIAAKAELESVRPTIVQWTWSGAATRNRYRRCRMSLIMEEPQELTELDDAIAVGIGLSKERNQPFARESWALLLDEC